MNKHKCHMCGKLATRLRLRDKYLCYYHAMECDLISEYFHAFRKIKRYFDKVKRFEAKRLEELSVELVRKYLDGSSNPLVKEAMKGIELRWKY